MDPVLNALHLIDEKREISLWIIASSGGHYSYEVVVRYFEFDRFDEDVKENDMRFPDVQSAAAAGVAQAIDIYKRGRGRVDHRP